MLSNEVTSKNLEIEKWRTLPNRSPQVLACRGRFYQGYKMKAGDTGVIVFQNSSMNNLCLWKFFPRECTLNFSCERFRVSQHSTQADCGSKVVTKVDGQTTKRWCGQVKPNNVETKRSLVVGYFALLKHVAHLDDQFKCQIRCRKSSSFINKPPVAKETMKCKCGVSNISNSPRMKRTTSLSRAIVPAALKHTTLAIPSPYYRIVGGTAAVESSVPWQASLVVNGEVFCGASVITDRHLLSAAHCTVQIEEDTMEKMEVLLNVYNIADKNKIRRKINKIVNHPKFDEETLANDISIISLKTILELNDGRKLTRYFFQLIKLLCRYYNTSLSTSKKLRP